MKPSAHVHLAVPSPPAVVSEGAWGRGHATQVSTLRGVCARAHEPCSAEICSSEHVQARAWCRAGDGVPDALGAAAAALHTVCLHGTADLCVPRLSAQVHIRHVSEGQAC